MVTLEQTQAARKRIHAAIDGAMDDLGGDPQTLIRESFETDGLEFLRRWLRPDIPPPPAIAVLFGMQWLQIEEARVAAAVDPAGWMFTHLGVTHGGVAATVLDTVLGGALQTTLPAGTGYATTDLHTRYLRPMSTGVGRVIATASVVHAGRRHATGEGRIEAEATGKLIATATAAFAILRPD